MPVRARMAVADYGACRGREGRCLPHKFDLKSGSEGALRRRAVVMSGSTGSPEPRLSVALGNVAESVLGAAEYCCASPSEAEAASIDGKDPVAQEIVGAHLLLRGGEAISPVGHRGWRYT